MKKNKESGITLVVLVVSIIILLMLAGISVGVTSSGRAMKRSTQNRIKKYNSVMKEHLDDIDEMNVN